MPMYEYKGHVYALLDLMRLFLPHVSLPAQPTAEQLAPYGITVIPDPEPDPGAALALARAAKLTELAAAFEAANAHGHFCSPTLGFEVDATERANRDVQGLLTLLEASGGTETAYCDYGNVMRTVTLEQLRALQLELIAWGQALYARKWALRTAIAAAASVEAVEAVEIEFDTLPAPTVPAAANEGGA